MSVMMGMVIKVDPARFEEVARERRELLEAVVERSKQAGAIHHAFYAGDGEVLVADEWPDEQSFLGFFEASGPDIGQLMAAAGVSGQPQPRFWRLIDTPDRF